MSATVRDARPSDMASLATWLDRDELDELVAGRDHDKKRVLVAAVGGQSVGAVMVSWAPADEPEIRESFSGLPLIFLLRVHPSHRRQRIGTRLVDRAMELLGHSRVLVGVDQSNLRAHKFYGAIGYKQEIALIGLEGDNGPFDVIILNSGSDKAAPDNDW